MPVHASCRNINRAWFESGVVRAAGAFDTFLNVQITMVLALQMALCLTGALISLAWRNSAGYARYYLALGIYSEGAQLRLNAFPAPSRPSQCLSSQMPLPVRSDSSACGFSVWKAQAWIPMLSL